MPIGVSDYEIIDLFQLAQNSVKDMISQIEFVRMVDVAQSETVERYIKDGKVKPDLSIPFWR